MGRRLTFARIDGTSATALFDEHGPFVWRTLRYLGVEDAALEDAMQDVFVTAFRRAADFEGRSSMRTWLFGVTRRVAFRYRRAASTRRRHIISDDTGAPEGEDDPHARADARRSVNQLVANLDRDKRAVFVLCELEGMTAAEVAEALTLPIGTVHSRRRAAWQRLERAAATDRAALSRAIAPLRNEEPEPAHQDRMRAALVMALGVPAKATAWAAVGGALLVGLVVARVAIGDVRADPPEPDRTERVAKAPEPTVHEPTAPAVEPAPEVETEPEVESPHLTPPTPTTRARPQPKPVAVVPPEDALKAELALVSAAKQQLRGGQVEAALRSLDDHARKFANGQLAEERDELRVEALCVLGRTDEARRIGGPGDPCASGRIERPGR